MQKVILKITATLISIVLLATDFTPALVYAANEMNVTNSNSVTSQENVKFDATINGKAETKAKITEGASLNLDFDVQNTGYLKDIKVEVSDSNYKLDEKVDDNSIKSISDNVIEINELIAGTTKSISIPISFDSSKNVTKDYFNKESKVTLNAVYVNEKGKEKKIKKEITEKLEWTQDVKENISQKLVRYLQYDANTMVSFEISDEIEDKLLPVTNKTITLTAPKIKDKNPSIAIVTGKDINYEYKDGNVTITKTINADENNSYSFDSKDTYTVTYIYDVQDSLTTIKSIASASVTTIKDEKVESNNNEETFEINGEVGSLVELDDLEPEKLSKGYLYTNLNRDDKLNTTYNETYKINIGYADLTDSIKIQENSIKFADENEKAITDASIKTSKISVSVDELVNVLGENGTITIKDEDSNTIGTISKNNLELVKLNSNKLTFELSKPEKEGDINLVIEKYIDGNNEYSKENIDTFKYITNEVEISSNKDGKQISDKKVASKIELTKPTSKASLDISTDNLSTVVKNENIVFNAILKTSDIDDALYKNPVLKITLPEEVQEIEVTDAKVLYDESITAGEINVDGRTIIVSLTGLETNYTSSAAADGALIRIVTNLTLNNLAPNDTKKITLEYSNELTGETNTIERDINIVAPSDFLTINQLTINNETKTAFENDADLIRVSKNDGNKTATISGTVINNLGHDATGVSIVGRIPTSGNKTEIGEDLGNNIDTTLESNVTTTLENATIYYSDNADETVYGEGWSEGYSSTSKAFKIVLNDNMADKSSVSFSYNIKLPQTLDYDQVAKAEYGVYFNNNADEGKTINLVQSRLVGFATKNRPKITMDISAIDTNSGFAIDNNGTVSEMEYVTYRVKITNNGSNDVNDVYFNAYLPSEMKLVSDSTIGIFHQGFDTIGAGETKTIEIDTLVSNQLSDNDSDKFITTFILNYDKDADDNSDDEDTKQKYTLNEQKGLLWLQLASTDSTVEKGSTASIYLNYQNASNENKDNVSVSVKLPKEVEYDGNDSSIKNKNNVLNVNLGTLEGYQTGTKEISVKVNDNFTEKINFVAEYDNGNEKVKSNTLTLKNKVTSTKVTASQITNIPDKRFLDTDNLQFIVEIKNDASDSKTVSFDDTISSVLSLQNVELYINDKFEKALTTTTFTGEQVSIPAKSVAKYVINAKPYRRNNNVVTKVENAPSITVDSVSIPVNTISLEMVGTLENDAVANAFTNQNEIVSTNETNEVVEQRSISGNVWLDNNKNGIKDNDEKKISNIKVSLFDNATKQVSKDSNGNNLETTTDENGNYTFNNVNTGDYIVVAEFNDQVYEVGAYNVDGVNSTQNSDFVQAKLGEKKVAASNTIKLSDANIYSINLALIPANKFDMKLDQKVSKIQIINTKKTKKNKTYNFDSNLGKIEVNSKDAQDTTVLIEYEIVVTNIGEVAGYAKNIVDYLPSGMTFSSELNPEWYIQDNNAYTTSLANTILNPGESQTIKLILSKKLTGENFGDIRNTAEIYETYNEYGFEDVNSKEGNKQDGEDDMSSTDAIILNSAGKENTAIVGIVLGIMAIITFAVYVVKKNVIDKMYNKE